MESMEVIDLSSDDENSPPRKAVHDEKKKVSPNNNNDDDIKIVANVVRKRKLTIGHAYNSSSPSKRIKHAKKDDPVNVLTNLLHKKPEISLQKIVKKRVKPNTISPLSTPSSLGSKPATELHNKNNSKTCYNAVKFTNDATLGEDTKSPNNRNNCHSFKINEGASSSTQNNIPQLTVMNTVKVSEVFDDVTTPSTEAFESFLEACRSRAPGKEMKIIISKLKKRYNNLEPPYAKSGSFIQLLRNKKNLILCNKAKLYLYISEVMDEMKVRQTKDRAAFRDKKQRGSRLADADSNRSLSNIPEEDAVDQKDSEFLNLRDQERLESLDKAMRRCERYIIKCEEAEVDFDDENDSNYIMAEKYKERMVQLYNKYCEITGQTADAARPYLRPKSLAVTPLSTLNNAITSFINMKITKMNRSMVTKSKKSQPQNLTDALIFPDYEDILECVQKCNDEENLQLNRSRVADIAKNAFSELGKYLQRCRHMDYYDTFSLYLEKGDGDPASDDETLALKLRENQELGKKKLDQVFQEYVEKQNAAKEAPNCSPSKKEADSKSADETSDDSDDEDSDSDDGKMIYDSEDTEYGLPKSELQDDAEPNRINGVEPSDNHTDEEEITKNEVTNEDHNRSHESLAVEETVRKSIHKNISESSENDIVKTKQATEMDISELCTGKVENGPKKDINIDTSGVSEGNIGDDVASNIDRDTSEPSKKEYLDDIKIIEERDGETIPLRSAVQQTDSKDEAIKVVRCDRTAEKTAGSSSTNVIASSPSLIQKATSTIATCKLNLVENDQQSEMKVVDKCSPVTAAKKIEVRDTPAMAISIEAVDKDEETQPKLRLRPFAKPPGSWEDFQFPTKSTAPETQTTRITDEDTESQKINKPTEREQNRFIRINKPTQIGKMVQVTKDVFINLTNKSSTVLIPPNSTTINPQINVKTVTNNVTVKFNNPSQFPTRITSIAPKNLIKINDSGKITRYANVGVINTTSNRDNVATGSTTTPTIKYKNQMIPIRNTTHQIRLVGPHTIGTSKVPRPIALNTLQKRPIVSQVPVVDENTTEKLYRIMKRPLGTNPQNINVPVTTGVQNQMPRSLNQRANSNLVTVAVPNVKLQISNSIRNTSPSKISRQYSKKDDKVYETSNDGVPTYLIE